MLKQNYSFFTMVMTLSSQWWNFSHSGNSTD